MALSPKGKQIWGSQQGGSLMRAMLGTKPMTEQDRQTLEQLKQGDQQQEPNPQPSQPEQNPKA